MKLLFSRLVSTLDWISVAKPTAVGWDRFAFGEMHIVYKLAKYLQPYVDDDASAASSTNKQHEELRTTLMSLMSRGYQCSSDQANQQSLLKKKITMDICSEVEWYKVIQLAWPEATTFVDVGANKGYLGSLFVALWGGGGLGISPAILYDYASQLKLWVKNAAGYCSDGKNHAIPLYCHASLRNQETGYCNDVREHVKVFSLDGSSFLATTLTGLIQGRFPNPSVKSGKIWQYRNYAVSDENGKAIFTKQEGAKNGGFEGGHMHNKELTSGTEEVEMITVDDFLVLNGVKRLDVLKIDAQGEDNKVIHGASNAIRDQIGVFTFESTKGVHFTSAMVKELDEIGYSCYSTSRAGLYKYNGGCMTDHFIDDPKNWEKGNVFCASRIRVPLVAFAFDALSFPILLSNISNAEDYHKGFINIRKQGFCKPFPSCVKD
jgi:FkbM family methyltransferase